LDAVGNGGEVKKKAGKERKEKRMVFFFLMSSKDFRDQKSKAPREAKKKSLRVLRRAQNK